MQLPSVMPILELVMEPFSLMRLAVLAVKLISLTAPEAQVSTADMATQRMLEYDVKV